MKTRIFPLIALLALAVSPGGWAIDHLPTGTQSGGVAINPVTRIAVMTNMGTGTLTVVDLNTRQVVRTLEVGGTPNGPAIDVGRNIVVYSDQADNTMVFRSLAEGGGELARVPVGLNPVCVGLNEAAGVAVAAGYHENSVVSIVDLETRTVTHTVPVGPLSNCMHDSINPNTMTAVVVSEGEGALQVIDLRTGTLRHTIPVGSVPVSASVNLRTNQAVVTLFGDNAIAIVDLNSNTITHRVAVGGGPACSVIDEAANVAYVSKLTEGSVSAVDLATGEVLGTLGPLGPEPACMAFDAAQSLVVMTSLSGQVSLLETREIIGSTFTPPTTAVESRTWGGVKARRGEP